MSTDENQITRAVTWAMADQLERLLLNAWGAISQADPGTLSLDFRIAVLAAAAEAVVRLAPESHDPGAQRLAYLKVLDEQLQLAQARRGGPDRALVALKSDDGPRSA